MNTPRSWVSGNLGNAERRNVNAIIEYLGLCGTQEIFSREFLSASTRYKLCYMTKRIFSRSKANILLVIYRVVWTLTIYVWDLGGASVVRVVSRSRPWCTHLNAWNTFLGGLQVETIKSGMILSVCLLETEPINWVETLLWIHIVQWAEFAQDTQPLRVGEKMNS